MFYRLLTLLLISTLLACKGGDVVSSKKTAASKTLNEKDKVNFGRLYIEASKEKILGNVEQSISLYQQAIKIDPTSAAAHYELGLVYNAAGDNQSAFEEFRIANQLDPQNFWYKLSYATFLQNQGQIDESIKLFKELVEENPDQLELKYELAKLMLNQGKIEEGVVYLNMIEEDLGITEEISFLKQRIYLSLNDVDKAANEIRLLIDAYPLRLGYYNTLANIYLSNEMPDEARKVLEELEGKDSSDHNVQFSLAKLHLKLGNQEEYKHYIILAFENPALDIDEKVKFILMNYQLGSDQKEKLAEGVELAEAVTRGHPDNAKSYALYADFLYFVDRDLDAMKAYQKTIQIDSSRFPVWNQLLVILSENDQEELLLDYGRRSIDLFPNQATLYLIYGLGLSSAKQYDEAIDYLELGKDLVIDNQALKSQFYSSLGDIHHELGNYQASDDNYDQALKLDPNNIYVLNNYSYYLSLRKERLEEAKKMSFKSNQLSPGQASFEDTYAWILYQLGEYEEALIWIDKALGTDYSSGVLLEHKGDILFKLGNTEEAVEYWKRAKEKGDASDTIDQKINEKTLYE